LYPTGTICPTERQIGTLKALLKTAELKDRAVRMVQQLRKEDPGDQGVIGRVARQLGVGTESLRTWCKRAEIDAGARPGVTTAERQEIAELQREIKELRRANEILRAAAIFFGAELDRPRMK
jgi:transposase